MGINVQCTRSRPTMRSNLIFTRSSWRHSGGGGPNVIEMASNLASAPKRRVNNKPETEERLYFSWKLSNPLLAIRPPALDQGGHRSTPGGMSIRLIPTGSGKSDWRNWKRTIAESKGKVFPNDDRQDGVREHSARERLHVPGDQATLSAGPLKTSLSLVARRLR